MYFCFYQTLPDSELVYNEEKGISRYVIFEAESAFHANSRAEENDFKWDALTGVGDQWYSVSNKDEQEEPRALGFEIDLLADLDPEVPITKLMDGAEGFVHFLDKQIVGFWY